MFGMLTPARKIIGTIVVFVVVGWTAYDSVYNLMAYGDFTCSWKKGRRHHRHLFSPDCYCKNIAKSKYDRTKYCSWYDGYEPEPDPDPDKPRTGFAFAEHAPDTLSTNGVDDHRIQQLHKISLEVHRYYDEKGRLPSADELFLSDDVGLSVDDLTDEDTGMYIEYDVVDESKFKLCDEFEAEEVGPQAWKHPAGWHCIEFTAFRLP